MPGWPALTSTLADASGIDIKNGGPKAASAYAKMFGRVQLIETIRHSHLRGNNPKAGTDLRGERPSWVKE